MSCHFTREALTGGLSSLHYESNDNFLKLPNLLAVARDMVRTVPFTGWAKFKI